MKKGLSVALVVAMVSSMFASVAMADDAATAQKPLTAEEKYKALADLKILEGDDQGANLDGKTTRAQIAKILSKAFNLTEDQASSSVYKDLDGAGWATGFIGAVTKAGYMDGVDDGKFDPSSNVTLEQLATVLARAYKLDTTSTDVGNAKVDNWAKGYVAAAIKAGLISASADFTAQALRSDLVNSAYVAVVAKEAVGMTAEFAVVDSKNVKVTFSDKTSMNVALETALEPGKETTVVAVYKNREFTGKVTLPVSVAKIASVTALSNTLVKVSLNDEVKSASAADYTITSEDNKALEVKSATFVDSKTILVETAAQTEGAVYTITSNGTSDKFVGQIVDGTAPKVSSAVATNNTTIEVTFNEELNAANALNVANYSIDNSLGAPVSASFKKDSGNKVVVLKTASQTVGTAYKVTVSNVTDLAGNVVNKDYVSAQFGGYPKDTDAPKVSTAYSSGNKEVKVTFNENVDATTGAVAANYTIDGLTVTAASVADNVVTLTTSAQTVGTVYKVVVANVTDTSGNLINKDYISAQFGGSPADVDAPKVSSAVASNSTTVIVNFNENVDATTGAVAANYTIDGLTVSKAVVDGMKVTLTTSAQAVGTVYKVVVANVTDKSGNVVNKDNNSFQFGGGAADTVAPKVSLAVSKGTNEVVVTFNEVVDDATASKGYNYYFGTELGYATKAVKNTDAAKGATDGTAYVLTTKAQAQAVYTVKVSNVKDAAGNVVDSNANSYTFGGQAGTGDNTAPKVASAVAINKNTVQVVFNEAVDATTAQAAANYAFSVSTGTESVTAPAVTVASVTYATYAKLADDKKTVTLQFGTAVMTPNVVYKVTVANVKDVALNTIAAADNTALFAGTSVDNPAPKVTSAVALNSQTLKITFSEQVAVDTTALVGAATPFTYTTNNGTITTYTGVLNKAELSSDKMSLTLYYKDDLDTATTTDKFAPTVIYTVVVNSTAGITDFLGATGLTIDGTANKQIFAGMNNDVTAPKAIAAVAVDQNTVDITFDQKVNTTSLINSDITVTGATYTVAGVRAEGSDGNKIRVFFNDTPFSAGTVYTVGVNAAHVWNYNGKALASDKNTSVFAAVGTPNAAPKLLTATATANNTITVKFSEKVTGQTAANFKVYVKGSTDVYSAVTAIDTTTLTDTVVLTLTTPTATSGALYEVGILTGITGEYGVGAADTATKVTFVAK